MQEQFCNRFGVEVTVCHYPPGCSKWNPVEHRLFSHISLNWAGQPLESLAKMLQLIRGTTTRSGLKVRARHLPGRFATGIKVSDKVMGTLNIVYHKVCPQWNYTIKPAVIPCPP